MGIENRVKCSVSAEKSKAHGGSAPLAESSTPTDLTTVCSACGQDAKPFHRLKHDGVVRHFCSCCVLFLYKGMYCCVCFLVYENPASKGPASLWVSCIKCQRIAHEKCASDRELLVDSPYFTCSKCSQPEQTLGQIGRASTEGNGSPPLKRPRPSVIDQSTCNSSSVDRQDLSRIPEVVLAASQIIAMLAVQHAKDAKRRARTSAAVAARAAACAKAALDTAFRVVQQEARWKLDTSRHLSGVLPRNNVGMPAAINAPQNTRTDGGVPSHGPLSYPNAPLNKDQTSEGDSTIASSHIPLNAGVAAQHNRIKDSPVSAKVTDALHQNGVFEKPQKLHVQETSPGLQNGRTCLEHEPSDINASPASILDAAASLDIPRPTSLLEPGPGHCSEVTATSDVKASSTVPLKDFLSVNGAPFQNAREQLSSVDERCKKCDDSHQIFVEEMARTSMLDVEGMDASPDGPIEISVHTGEKELL